MKRRWLGLRSRLLTAMGLPLVGAVAACATASPPPPPPPTGAGGGALYSQGQGAGPSAGAGNLVMASAPSRACGFDQVHEQVCGTVASSPQELRDCGPTGDALVGYGGNSWVMQPAGYHAHDKTFASFHYDQAATDIYRSTMKPVPQRQNYCCYSRCTQAKVAQQAPVLPSGPTQLAMERCLPAFQNGTSAPAANAPQCAAAMEVRGVMMGFGRMQGAQCCYHQYRSRPPEMDMHPRGRPLRVAGRAVQADVAQGRGWSGHEALAALTVSPALRDELTEAWLAEAKLEHASVAAFAKLSLQLMAHGAPAELLAAAHAAAIDEVAHAEVAFTLASCFAGEPLAPSAWPAATGAIGAELRELLADTLKDGCVGETIAAEEAAEAARRAVPAIAAAVRGIADDERRHAELSWRIAAWACRRDPAMARELLVALITELRAELREPPPAGSCDNRLEGYGVLCHHDRLTLRREIVEQVALPCLQTLLASCIESQAAISSRADEPLVLATT